MSRTPKPEKKIVILDSDVYQASAIVNDFIYPNFEEIQEIFYIGSEHQFNEHMRDRTELDKFGPNYFLLDGNALFYDPFDIDKIGSAEKAISNIGSFPEQNTAGIRMYDRVRKEFPNAHVAILDLTGQTFPENYFVIRKNEQPDKRENLENRIPYFLSQ